MHLGGPGPYFCGRRGVSLFCARALRGCRSKFKQCLEAESFPRASDATGTPRAGYDDDAAASDAREYARLEQCGRAELSQIVDECADLLLRRTLQTRGFHAENDARKPRKREAESGGLPALLVSYRRASSAPASIGCHDHKSANARLRECKTTIDHCWQHSSP